MTAKNSARRQSGFTVLELSIATLVAMLVLLIAMDTLRVSLGAVAIAGDESTIRGAREWPVTLLRRDVRRATSLGSESIAWTRGSLVLITDRGVMTYRRGDDRHLVRTFVPASGSTELPDEAIVLAHATSWRWRSLPGGVVQVEFGNRSRRSRSDIHGTRRERLEQLVLKRRAGRHRAHW